MGKERVPRFLKVLHIEDSQDDAELIRIELKTVRHDISCRRVETAVDMADALAAERWDLVISDFNLPAFDAYEALHILKASGQDIPFIIVSGCIGEEAAVALMKAGAHDYVTKDNLARLVPALERELKDAEVRRQRRYAEEALLASEKLLRDIASVLGEGLLVQDKDGRLMFMNREAERLLGWSEFELATRDIHESIHYLRPDGTYFAKEECPVSSLMQEGVRFQTDDAVFVRKDGTPFPVAYVITPIIECGQLFATVTAFRDITASKQAELELRESRRQLQELSVFLQAVREEERARIARELHDELGQTLTALRIDLNWLGLKLPDAERHIVDKLISMENLVNKTVDSMRRISEDLRPGMLDDLGLAAAIEHHVAKFTEQTGIFCGLDMSQDDFELSDQVATAVFRILQESLTNVARHAAATEVKIGLQDLGDEMLLIVQDNGRGLPDAPTGKKKTYGLLGMRERVKMLRGWLEISSEPNQGTRIEARIPNQAEVAEQ